MNTVLIAIKIPKNIKSQLNRVCYGLPNINWLDPEDFLITIKSLGRLDGSVILDVQERLEVLKTHPFNLKLEGIEVVPPKSKSGTVTAKVKGDTLFYNLGKEINDLLGPLKLAKFEREFDPHVVLGHFDQVQPLKVINFLEAQSGFSTDYFLVVEIVLVSIELTAKSLYYFEHKRFPLGQSL